MQHFLKLCLLIIGLPLIANAEAYNLPLQSTTDVAKVTFTVDSTWHTVHGKVGTLNGEVWLVDPLNQGSLRAEIDADVHSITTGMSMRDEKLWEVMAATTHPKIHFSLKEAQGRCPLGEISTTKQCPVTFLATLTIRGVTKELTFSGEIQRHASNIVTVTGKTDLLWSDFGVEDPSILIAKLDKKVTVSFKINVPTVP